MVQHPRVDGRQTFNWLLVAELEMAPPEWGRPLRGSDVRAIAGAFDPDMLGAICVWARPDLAPSRGRYTVVDGQHRVAAVRLMGYDDQRVPCVVYEGLTQETAAELSLGLQERRNLHAYDKHRGELVAHERRAVEVDKVLRLLDLTMWYTSRPADRRRVTCVATVNQVWDRMGAPGLERVLTVCDQAWEGTGFLGGILKLTMTVLAAHNGQVDDAHLAETLGSRSPAQWLARDAVPRRPLASIAQDVILEYNRKARGRNRLPELTPSQYQQAARRTPTAPRVRGKIAARTVANSPSRTYSRRPRASKATKS